MNCKPGQPCRVITSGPFFGVVVTVTDWVDFGYGPAWYFEEGPFYVIDQDGDGGWQEQFFDRVLRPIDGSESPEESIEAMRLLTHIPGEVTA